jgi:raffinose/stachyose/melibiose transport system permease protein
MTPPTVLLLEAFFEGFPRELTDAARVDGMSGIMAFIKIVLRLSLGALITVSLLGVLFVWSEAQLGVAFLGSSGSRTVAVGMLGFVGLYSSNTGALFAGLTLSMVPIVVLYVVFRRHVAAGVTLSGTIR